MMNGMIILNPDNGINHPPYTDEIMGYKNLFSIKSAFGGRIIAKCEVFQI